MVFQRVVIKKLYMNPVFTREDILTLFEYLDQKGWLEWKIYCGFILFCGMRPSEVINLCWRNLRFDEKTRTFTEITHLIYKPRRVSNKMSTSLLYKCIRKPILSKVFSSWLLQYYESHARHCQDDRLFFWKCSSNLDKLFGDLRKHCRAEKLDPRYAVFLEIISEERSGCWEQYRLTPYGLRRTCISFLTYQLFDGDIIKISKWIGHQHTATTLDHYCYPPSAIGLTDEDRKRKVDFDEWLFKGESKQSELPVFYDEKHWIKSRFGVQLNQQHL